jgi:hypothetical protein
MCIIPGPIQSVNQTKLFVMPSKDKQRQMTFYSNAVETKDENLMILPVPNPGTLKLHTVKYKRMFRDLERSVAKIHYQAIDLCSRVYSAALTSTDTLEILDHGSYRVSIAPTVQDLFRLDTTVFHLTPDLYQFFEKHYTSEFGYLCCVLKPGVITYEPLCYSHALHSTKKLFVPTLHYHNHDGKVSTDTADWDHCIYSVGTTEQANCKYHSLSTNFVKWKQFPEEFQWSDADFVRCAEIVGNRTNCDIAFALA